MFENFNDWMVVLTSTTLFDTPPKGREVPVVSKFVKMTSFVATGTARSQLRALDHFLSPATPVQVIVAENAAGAISHASRATNSPIANRLEYGISAWCSSGFGEREMQDR